MPSDKSFTALCAQVVRLLREERERRGLSKYAIAERSGLSQQMVGYVEKGLRCPSLETAMRMADAIGIDLEEVIRQARKETAKPNRK